MRNQVFAISALISAALVASASATVYTSSATFLANIQAGAYTNNFSSVASGPSAALNFSSGGFAYTVDSAPTSNDLYNDPGVISTNNSGEQILVTFTSGNVTAVGGNFWGTDVNVAPVAGSPVVLTLSDGTIETYTSSAATAYRGFTSALPITSLLIDAPTSTVATNIWPTLDNLTVGRAVVPEPASLSLVAVGAAMLRRRRA